MAQKKNPLVTIVIPSYNHENYIKKAVFSALNSTYKNIQVIVIDDGSKDNSPKILEELNKEYDFELILKENTGLVKTLNLALQKYVKGDYVKLLSSDDVVPRDAINNGVNFFINHPQHDVIIGAYYKIDSFGNISRLKQPKKGKFISYKNFVKGKYSFHTTAIFLKTSFFKIYGGYKEDIVAEDLYLHRKIFKFANIAFVDFALSYYRIHDTNTTKQEWLMYQESLKNLETYKDDPFYNLKKRIEYLNYFVLLSSSYKKESLTYFFPSLLFFYKKQFIVGILNLLNLSKFIKNE